PALASTALVRSVRCEGNRDQSPTIAKKREFDVEVEAIRRRRNDPGCLPGVGPTVRDDGDEALHAEGRLVDIHFAGIGWKRSSGKSVDHLDAFGVGRAPRGVA